MIIALYLLHVLFATRIQFMDKSTLGSSAILGILSVSFFLKLQVDDPDVNAPYHRESTHLTTNQ
jgi:hypothetical protein